MTHWEHLCLMSDSKRRLFLYDMNEQLFEWSLLYCWSPPTTCELDENIAAIGINEDHIALSIQRDNQYRFALYEHDMTHFSDVQLTRPCNAIQALPYGEWLLYDYTEKLYYVIDSELEQHEEPDLSSLKNIKCVVTCDETGKVLVVLLDKQGTEQIASTNKNFGFGVQQNDQYDRYNVKIYMNDC
jgi:hypothetical protein